MTTATMPTRAAKAGAGGRALGAKAGGEVGAHGKSSASLHDEDQMQVCFSPKPEGVAGTPVAAAGDATGGASGPCSRRTDEDAGSWSSRWPLLAFFVPR